MADEFLVHANEEQSHADRICTRIVQLGGEPDLNPDSLTSRSHADYNDELDLHAMIRSNLVAERVAIEAYTQMIDLIYKSAPLHDIGKIGIPDHILLKPGKLTDHEFEVVKEHTLLGRKAIEGAERRLGMRVRFLNVAKDMACCHHERWDGTGYPLCLAGDAIPVPGRLMALADVYDAIISRRIYKSASTHDQACSAIVKGRGTQFDPDVVDAFIDIAEEFRDIALKYPD